MFKSIMGIACLIFSFTGFSASVYTLNLFEYTSIASVGIWSTALASAFIGCWLILRR